MAVVNFVPQTLKTNTDINKQFAAINKAPLLDRVRSLRAAISTGVVFCWHSVTDFICQGFRACYALGVCGYYNSIEYFLQRFFKALFWEIDISLTSFEMKIEVSVPVIR